jgi:diguanylate cyclase (GGDEF)-like protein
MKSGVQGVGSGRWAVRGALLRFAAGYGADLALLAGFAATGTVAWSIPSAYLAVALADGALLLWMSRNLRSSSPRQPGHLLHLLWAIAVQLSFAVLAPSLAFYFIATLFIVCGTAAMNVSAAQSALAWAGVAGASALWVMHAGRLDWALQATRAQRMLLWLCFVTLLGRFVLFGVQGRSLRLRLRHRSLQLVESVDALKERDLSLERVNAELHYQATHDALTGLANRVLFAERLEQAVAAGKPFALCLLDLDRFKIINDSMGHGVGDALLKLVGRRLLSATRPQDAVARAGGDEFLLLLSDTSDAQELTALASRWMSTLSEPYRIQGAELHISPSIGIARYPLDAIEGEELLARADEAMYQAKHNGRGMFRFYDAEVMGCSRERLALEADLRQALGLGQLRLHYQPKIDIMTGKTRSVEALLRWLHPTRGLVPPEEFLPIAEDTGLILPIGEWVIREACRQTRAWQTQGLQLRVAVNISPIQFRQVNFAAQVREALAAHSLDSGCLEIELTEATLMSNAERSVAVLEQLSRLGLIVAIDDFGTGYSSMLYLQRFPVDKLKIDRSFIRDLERDSNDASIVRAIISLAHGLRLQVVAEGVETPEQLEMLRRLGCDQYQGFLRSAAVPAEEMAAVLQSDCTADSRVIEHQFGKLAHLVRGRR